jgi:hypothetical protein
VNLKFTFRRTVNRELMDQWEEVAQIAMSIQFREEEDALIWQFNSSGIYSVQSMYVVVNNRGVRQLFTPVMWKIKVPSRIHLFLWLLNNNKTLTKDNLAKRRKVDDGTSCLFCNEQESVNHLFFHCCIAHTFWGCISRISAVDIGSDYESVGKLWLQEKKYRLLNVLSSAVLWPYGETLNIFVFSGQAVEEPMGAR